MPILIVNSINASRVYITLRIAGIVQVMVPISINVALALQRSSAVSASKKTHLRAIHNVRMKITDR